MAKRIFCPHCRASLSDDGLPAGHLVTCPECKRQFQMPHPQAIVQGGDVFAGQGSAGNVVAALSSFFIPGLGQLIQGRLLAAALHFIFAGVLWIILLGWIVHLWSIYDAATYKPR